MAKAVSGHDPTLLIDEPTYFATAGLELAIGAALLFRSTVTVASVVGIVLAACGVVLAAVADGRCGCLGVWVQLTRREHMLLAAVYGSACVVVLRTRAMTGGATWRPLDAQRQ